MDGSNITRLHPVYHLTSLALDHDAQVLYWCQDFQEIWSINVDGTNPTLLLSAPHENTISAITEWDGLVYWSDGGGIHSIEKNGSNTTTLTESLCNHIFGLAVIGGGKQDLEPGNLLKLTQCDNYTVITLAVVM